MWLNSSGTGYADTVGSQGYTLSSPAYANYQGQLESVAYTAYEPSISAMTTITVANYAYDTTGKLRAVCDPRRATPLVAPTPTIPLAAFLLSRRRA